MIFTAAKKSVIYIKNFKKIKPYLSFSVWKNPKLRATLKP